MKHLKKILVCILIISLNVTIFSTDTLAAKKSEPTMTSKRDVYIGNTALIKVNKQNTKIKSLSWASSNSKIAKVKKKSTYTALVRTYEIGKTTVTAKVKYVYKKKTYTFVLVCQIIVYDENTYPGVTKTTKPYVVTEHPTTWHPPTPTPKPDPGYIYFTADPTNFPTEVPPFLTAIPTVTDAPTNVPMPTIAVYSPIPTISATPTATVSATASVSPAPTVTASVTPRATTGTVTPTPTASTIVSPSAVTASPGAATGSSGSGGSATGSSTNLHLLLPKETQKPKSPIPDSDEPKRRTAISILFFRRDW